MSYEDRVMRRLVSARFQVDLLQRKLASQQLDMLTITGELEAIKMMLDRTLLEPVIDPPATDVQARGLTLVKVDQPTEEEV